MYTIDLDKLKKYDKPGPRYTSYPTAPQFHEKFTRDDLTNEIKRTNENGNSADLSLYFHLPYCDTLCYFCGCNMIITRNRGRIGGYTEYLKREIDLYRKLINRDRKVEQLHWGGGTPTHLNPGEITGLISYINRNFEYTPDAEIGCEIDPRGLTKEHLEALRNGGFNRISMGVQDFNDKVQIAINRIQPEDITRQACDWTKELGFLSMNIDLIYGLPFQTPESFEETVDTIIDISPDRLAVFNYAHVPWLKKHQNILTDKDLPKPEEKFEILKMTIEKLTGAGYVFIGMDHFAKPEDELTVALREKKLYRNFQGYSTHSGADLYAMGITSISQLPMVYSQNHKEEKAYYDSIDSGLIPIARGYTMNEDDIIRRKVVMNLMCHFVLEFQQIEDEFGIHFDEYFAWGLENLKEFADDGLVTMDDNRIVVTELGRLMIRTIAMNFDGYIERQVDKTKYSRTV
ncbi:oxygen-independent coproporphyrinogen III oxidase [candidate division KSB1 bacterium]|nr:oxygen-independent coproporphyrinogen III oxidase [candidate division KSB1 bacterium]